MKGTFFQKPVEYTIKIEGEKWLQGDPVAGMLQIKNHGSAPFPLSGVAVHLARGQLKKVHQKSPEAFDILATVPIPQSGELAGSAEASFPWKFETDRGFPITDSQFSPFAVYGSGTQTESMGQLQLAFYPEKLIEEFLSRISVSFRFVRKAVKFSKGRVEAKLAPPDGQAFTTLEHVTIGFRFDGDDLDVSYQFAVKKVEATAASFDLKKSKREFEQKLPKHSYLTPSGRFNHDGIEAAIREALETVQAKVLF